MKRHLSPSEQATLHFYEWEQFDRGHHLYDHIVSLEPIYTSFQRQPYKASQIDDGLRPNLLKRVVKGIENIILESPNQLKEEDLNHRHPYVFESSEKDLCGIGISFSNQHQFDTTLWLEFINVISITELPLSFEIIGNSESISIQLICYLVDELRIRRHLNVYFPNAILKDVSYFDLPFDFKREVALCDFGLEEECMRPIETQSKSQLDTLTSFISQLDQL